MRLKSRTPRLAALYRPARPQEIADEIKARNTQRVLDYYVRRANHTADQAKRRTARRHHLLRAFSTRRDPLH